MSATALYDQLLDHEPYFDRKANLPKEEYLALLAKTTTLYVGNLSPAVTEETLLQLFSAVSDVRQVIVGINKRNFRPCGFCFVELADRRGAEWCHGQLDGFPLAGRPLKLDFDIGFQEGRQYGRGFEGGQRQDEAEEREKKQSSSRGEKKEKQV